MHACTYTQRESSNYIPTEADCVCIYVCVVACYNVHVCVCVASEMDGELTVNGLHDDISAVPEVAGDGLG